MINERIQPQIAMILKNCSKSKRNNSYNEVINIMGFHFEYFLKSLHIQRQKQITYIALLQ